MAQQVAHWTDARVRGFIVGVLRQGMRRWPPKFEVLKNAQTGVKRNKLTKRDAMHYKCAECKKLFPRTKVQVDHIDPVVKGGFKDWNTYIERMYCGADNMQVLCKPCHLAKSKVDRAKK